MTTPVASLIAMAEHKQSAREIVSINIDSIMADVDANLVPYVMPEVTHLFPLLSINKDSKEGKWFLNSIFWAANVAAHGKESGFLHATYGSEASISFAPTHIERMIREEHRSAMTIAQEVTRFKRMIGSLKHKVLTPSPVPVAEQPVAVDEPYEPGYNPLTDWKG
jgi:hypothetical protein